MDFETYRAYSAPAEREQRAVAAGPVATAQASGTKGLGSTELETEELRRARRKENLMKDYSNKNETAFRKFMSERYEDELLQHHGRMLADRQGIVRVIGKDHPVVRLIEIAFQSGDPEDLEVAQAAYDTLPERVLNRARHPWIGHPPPSGTRQKLREEHASVLVGEEMPGPDPVGCYLQIDAREGYGAEVAWTTDEEGHVFDAAIVYDLRNSSWPVRVQICEGSDKETALALLKEICKKIAKDWDMLTDPDRPFRPPKEPVAF